MPSDRKTDRQKQLHELWVCKAQLNLFVTQCEFKFFRSFLDYTTVYQQQQHTVYWAQRYNEVNTVVNCSGVEVYLHAFSARQLDEYLQLT